MTEAPFLDRLRAAIDEAEQTAKACPTRVWSADPTGTVCADEDLRPSADGSPVLAPIGEGPQEVAECYRDEVRGERAANAAHIALNDPARVLRQVEQHQAVLDRHTPVLAFSYCSCCLDTTGTNEAWPCVEVLSVAAVYEVTP